jgi:hypothetical protein
MAADATVSIGVAGLDKALRDFGGTEYGDMVEAILPTSVSAFTTQVNAASVAAGATSVLDATATGGKRYARIRISCDKAHTIKCYGADADFALIANGYVLPDFTKTGVAATTGTLGNSYVVDCSGCAFFAVAVTNNDGASAATVTASVAFSD